MGRDSKPLTERYQYGHFNPLSPHGERQKNSNGSVSSKISIHSPRMGRDRCWQKGRHLLVDFNPLSPHGERPVRMRVNGEIILISIHSPRMGRDNSRRKGVRFERISIHSPRMGRDMSKIEIIRRPTISIHSPRMGRDSRPAPKIWKSSKFQSTLPAWGETWRCGCLRILHAISIHSPRMGRDPCFDQFFFCCTISIHSPRMGRDQRAGFRAVKCSYFNPLSPHGERPAGGLPMGARPKNFNPLSPHGERRQFGAGVIPPLNFNPLSPHGERQQTHTTFRREKLAHLHNIVSFRQQRGSSC